MRANFGISSLVPSGLVIESVSNAAETIIVTVRRGTGAAVCPLCKQPSRRVHSRYLRGALDLPCSGQSVRLRVMTRRFLCATGDCRRRIPVTMKSERISHWRKMRRSRARFSELET